MEKSTGAQTAPEAKRNLPRDGSDAEQAGGAWTGEVPLFLHDLWYFVLPSRRLRKSCTVAKRILDVPLLIGRDRKGAPFALHNVCRHQGMPLSCGRFEGVHLECSNHGWRYDTAGVVVAIPGLVPGSAVDLTRLRVRSYPCRDVQGNMWVYMGDDTGELTPPVPEIPDVGERGPDIDETMVFRCSADRAALGLIDPAHGPFVHRSWFWRTGHDPQEKVRRFIPSHLGFTMERHTPTSNTRALRFLSGKPEFEIRFQLPGVHIEHVKIGRHVISGMITVTPVTPTETEVSYSMYWNVPWLRLFRPLVKLFTHAFFEQDRRAMDRMAEVPVEKRLIALIGDPDAQALWYFQLKKEFVRARAEKRPFRNPLREATLRWRT